MATTEWHYTIDGQPAVAPVSPAQLKQLAAAGQLKPTDLVWQDGMLEWAQAGSIKGLFPANKNLGDSAVVPPTATTKIAEGRKTVKIRPPRDWSNIHPLLVFVLSLLSGGIFGLIYADKICRAYSAKAAGRKNDAAGRALGKVRHPFGVLLLSYLTLGFYFYYWLYRAFGECNDYLGRKDVQPRTELSLMLIFPPYALYIAVFVLPELIRKAQTLAGMPETPGLRISVFFVNPIWVFVLPVLAMICQETLNQIWLTAP
ncbi:MAG TPA: GYF domain-containing protein [Gemmataceae bacterium]|nr:GYF domain-containing protein [Gemmataceae bacterium]